MSFFSYLVSIRTILYLDSSNGKCKFMHNRRNIFCNPNSNNISKNRVGEFDTLFPGRQEEKEREIHVQRKT